MIVELTETEYMVRGKGYLRGISDLENLVVKAHEGMPVSSMSRVDSDLMSAVASPNSTEKERLFRVSQWRGMVKTLSM